ncbi:translocation/assembly module TamB domain-containing protein [Bartonella sp. B41]
MKKIVYLLIFLCGFSFLLVSAFVFAQRVNLLSSETDSGEDSWIVSFIERRLSTPNRQIRFHNMQGALSSQTSIDAITVSDDKGVWLKIINAKIDWNRLALLRGRVEINHLAVEQVTFLRKPKDFSFASSIEKKEFSLPKLPIAISINTLIAEHVAFERDLFGFSSDLFLKGHLTLVDGDYDADITAYRLDALGSFSILTKIFNGDRTAKIDISVNEPQNGIIASILNIEERPALNFSIRGDGTFDDLVAKLYLEADHHRVLDGNVTLASISEGYSFSTKMAGTLSSLVSSQYRNLFESDVTLEAEARMTREGVTHLDHMAIQGEAINIVTNAEITADGFLRRLFFDGKIAFSKKEKSVHSSVLEAPVHTNNFALTIDYGREGQQFWKGQFVVHHFSNKNVYIHDAVFDLGGVSENLDNVASRHVGIQVSGMLKGIVKSKNAFVKGLDQTIHVHLDTDIFSKKPVLIHNFSVTAPDFSAWLKGKVDHFIFKGDLGLEAKTLTPLGLLSERPLSGSADLRARGAIGLIGGIFDLDLSGGANDVKTGIEFFDRLFRGNLTLSGGIAQSSAGLVLRRLNLKNQFANVRADGYFSNENAKMVLSAQISDLTILDPRLSGSLTVQGAAKGRDNLIEVNTRIRVDEAFFVGKKLQETTLAINTLVDNTSPVTSHLTGSVEGKGIFAKKPLYLSASFEGSDRVRQLRNIDIRGGSARIVGDLSQISAGFVKGFLHVDAEDISDISALFLQEGSGKIKGDFIFDEQNGRQKANLKASIDHLNFAKNKIKKFSVEADIFDLFGKMQFEGFINAEHVQTPFMLINRLNVRANRENEQTTFAIKATLLNNINAQFSGRMIAVGLPAGIRRKVWIETMDVQQPNFHVMLPKPAEVIFDKDGIMLSEFGVSVNGGNIVLSGNFYDTFNMHLTMNSFPVTLANLWKPDLGVAGTLTGKIIVHGDLKNPKIAYDIKGEDITSVTLQEKKIAPFIFSAIGKTVNHALTVNADLMGERLQAQAQGTVSLGKKVLDLHVNVKKLPAYLANSFIEKQALDGTITGKIDISGTFEDPSVHFDFSSQNLTVTTYKELAPVSINTRGSYEELTLHIEHFTAIGYKGLDLSISGPISFKDSSIGLNVKGVIPFAFFDPFLAERGAYATGIAKIDASLGGALSQPQMVGSFSLINGNFFDSKTNLNLRNIKIEGKLDGNHIVIKQASASSSSGGSIFASGHITNDLHADLVIGLDNANYNDGSIIFATLSGKITVTGYFLGNFVIGGDVTVEKAEIFVPDHFKNAKFLDIKNKNLTKPIKKTLERADVKGVSYSSGLSQRSPSIVQLNIKINARNQFFVRGRGLDTELGGRVNLTGSLHDVHPVGEFQMIRGRFDILSQRLEFDQGKASFSGNLNPTVYFVTNNDIGDIRITVTVSGAIDNLDVNFSSQPNLPQDEILARLIFNRSLSELSPFQIAQLAAAAANLAGATNTSLLNTLRTKIGLDDLDVVIDKNGNTGLRIGRYIHNNVYLGFEAGSDGTTKGTVNLDVSRNFKAKSTIGNENNFSIGLFYEKDY